MNRGRRGQGSGRRKRPRDADRERARPTRTERHFAAAGNGAESAISLTSETSGDDAEPPLSPSPHPVGRPLTVFTQHVDPSPVTRPPTSSSSRPALLRAVSDPQSAFVAEDVDATSACPIFEHQALQQELPDEFLAMASILGRSYAGSSQSDLRGVASRWRTRANPVTTSSAGWRGSEHVRSEQERSRSSGPPSRPERRIPARSADSSSRRSWPAGAALGCRFASSDASDVMLVGNTTVLRPRPKLRTRSPVPLDTVDLTDTTELPELVEPSPPILQVEEQPHAGCGRDAL